MTAPLDSIDYDTFAAVDLRVGTIIEVDPFPEARKPAYKLTIDFGDELGTRRSSAQITTKYKPADLVGKHVVAVVNFPPKQIGPFVSEVLVTGFQDSEGHVVLTTVDAAVPNGARLH